MTIWYYSLHGELMPVTLAEEDVAELLERRFNSVGIYFFGHVDD